MANSAKAPKQQKQPLSTKTIGIWAAAIAGLVLLLGGVYVYGLQQGKSLFAQNVQNSIVPALVADEAETKVDGIVGELDDLAATTEALEAAEKEAVAQAEAQKQAQVAPKAEKTQTTAPKQESSEKKPMRSVTLSNPLVSVEDAAVVFSAQLSESVVGSCKVFLQKQGDKAGAWHYNKSDSARTKCVTSISREQLSAGTWNYELTFMSDSVYGAGNPKGSFTLE